ncbi:MAG: serine hydrolase [Alphaproteobacteria bacterium]|nr:serine hydrolase [Alphaproteobacteria bacterium]
MRVRRAFLALVAALAWQHAAWALETLPVQPPDAAWPTLQWEERGPGPNVDGFRLKALLDQAFAQPAPDDLPGTRAVLIVHHGRLVTERYADGFGPDRKFLSQSMAKTVLAALVGVLAGDGRLSLDAPAPVPAWRERDDPRHAITLRDLLQMRGGLNFDEAYFNPFTSDVLPMLFGRHRDDMAAFAAERGLAAAPGTRWSYSSGTANIVSGIVRDTVGGSRAAYLAFMRRALFGPIGMKSAEPEFDRAGTFVASSWLHATARDWARFGLLLLRGGIWNGRLVLPEGWVDFMRTPTAASHGAYGALTWLNGPEGGPRRYPGLPADVFMALGHGGQVILMVPSRDLVIVRLGRTGYDHYDYLFRWLGEVAGAFPDD